MLSVRFTLLFFMGIVLAGLSYGQTSKQLSSTESLPADTLFNREVTALISASDLTQKEAIYRDLIKKFPENGTDFRKQRYSNVRTSLALFWSSQGNAAKTMEYYNQINNEGFSSGLAIAIASNLVKNRHYEEALTILKGVIEPVTDAVNTKNGSMYTFLQAYDGYAQALFNLGKKAEALGYIQKAYDKSDKKNTAVNSTYATILHGLGRHEEALPIMAQLVGDGMAAEEIKDLFRDSYLKTNGSTENFRKQMISLRKALKTKMEQEAEEKMINEPGFAFTLRDINGKMVSLADMKGKVLVLDFWATWCGPCVRSMPAMQMLVNDYEDDPNVKFLFIDTGEKIPDYENAVKKLLHDNKYDFHVVYDVRNEETKKYPVASGYAIKGIPTKLVLDGEGNVRYRVVGFNGGNDATVAELTAMIKKTKRTLAVQGSPYTIKGTSYLKEGIAILNDYHDSDTARIVDGKFEFHGNISGSNLISIEVPPTRSSRIIMEPGVITVTHTQGGYRFGGAPLNVRFQKIEDGLKPVNDKISTLWSKYNKAEGAERVKIWREYDQAKKDKMAKTMQLTTADKTFAGFIETLPVVRYETAANVRRYLDTFKEFADDPRYKSLLEFYEGAARTDFGVTPPQWTLPDPQGKNISLASLKGKYVLIDFWYSGCHWCRKMTPGLINIYNDLKDQGLEIISVSVDPEKDEDKWREAMKEDGAPWLQVWDADKTLPEQYSVQGYPTMFFLGPDGKVLRKIIGYHDEPILREFFTVGMNKDKNNSAKK